MKNVCLFFLVAAVLPARAAMPVDAAEPPVIYTLNIGGQKRDLRLDEITHLSGTFTNPDILLQASPIRTFAYAGLSFIYPSQFTWHAEVLGPEKTWTMTGTDFKLVVFSFDYEIQTQRMAANMAKEFQVPEDSIREITRRINDVDATGYGLTITQVGVRMVVEIIKIPTRTGGRVLLMQDTPPSNAEVSKEAELAKQLLDKSFKITQQDVVIPKSAAAGN